MREGVGDGGGVGGRGAGDEDIVNAIDRTDVSLHFNAHLTMAPLLERIDIDGLS